MSTLPAWIIRGGQAIDFREIADLIGPVGDFAKTWQPIGKGLIEIGRSAEKIETPGQLITFVLANIDDASVVAVLDEIDGDLAPKLKKVKTKYESSELKKLLQPVGALTEAYLPKTDETINFDRGTNTGLIDLKIPQKSTTGSTSLGKLDLTFGISGEAALELEAGAVWPFESDEVEPGMLRLGARGEFGVEAEGKLPVAAWLSIGGEAKVSAEAELGYFYRPKPEELFFETVEPAFTGLANPANLQALANAMAYHRLEGVVILIDGSATGKANVDLGQSLALGPVGVDLGLSGSVHYARQSKWALSLRKSVVGYDVVLSRLKGRESGWKAGLGLSVDVSELAQKATKALDEVTDFTGPKLKKIKPFLSPGTYALEKLDGLLGNAVDELLKDEAIAKALKSDLGLLLGGKAGDELAIQNALQDKLTAAIDEVTGGIARDATEFADTTIDNLVAKLPDITANGIAKRGKDEIGKLIKKLTDDFTETLNGLVANSASTNALARELADIGTKVKSGADKADDALKKVREFVAAYEQLVKDARDILEKLAKTEIGMQLESSFTKSESAHYEVLGTITDVGDPEAVELWHELALGRLQAIERMLVDPSLTPKGFALSAKSSLALAAQSMRKKGVTIDLLGDVYKVQVTATGKAEIAFKGGTVTVKNTAEATRLRSTFGTTRSSSFLSVVELQQFKSGDNARSIDLSVEFMRKDENLKMKELDTFLEDLGNQNLISAPQSDHARALLQAARLESNGKLKGDIGFRMELSPKQLNTLLVIGEVATKHAEVERALFTLAAKMIIGTHGLNPTRIPRALKLLTGQKNLNDQLAGYWDSRATLRRGGNTTDRIWRQIKPLRDVLPLFEGLARIFMSLHRTHATLPTTPFDDGWTVDDYRKEQQRIADAASSWIKTKSDILRGKLHPAMLTILHVFIALDRNELPSDKEGIVDFVKRMYEPLEPNSQASTLQISMQIGAAEEATII